MATGTVAENPSKQTAIMRMDPRAATIRDILVRSKEGLQQALPKHMTAERMIRVAMTVIQKTPKLMECDQRSLIGAIVEASQLGLEPDGVLGHAYLVPYTLNKGKPNEITICQLIPGYKGLIDLSRRSGTVKTIEARIVYEKDEFDFSYGLNPKCEHRPSRLPDPGKPIYIYAIGHLLNGGVQYEVMTVREVEAIRSRSRASKNGPWVTDWEAMAKKTVLRRLCKLLPVSVETQKAIAIDERDDTATPLVNLGVGLDLDIPEAETAILEVPEEVETAPETLDEVADEIEQKKPRGPRGDDEGPPE